MSVALGMDVSEGGDDLAKEVASFRFAQSVLGNDVVKEFTARAILRHTKWRLLLKLRTG